MLDAEAISSRIRSILGESRILIHHVRGNFFIFDPDSILMCLKINIQVDLIGPFPRQVTSERTAIPGLLTPYQTDLLKCATHNVTFVEGERDRTEGERERNEEISLQIHQNVQKEVTRRHAEIAQTYGQDVDLAGLMAKYVPVTRDKLRWRISFLCDLFPIDPYIISDPVMPDICPAISACHAALWQAGLFLTSGLKFGCDWLAYSGPPDIFHAKYIVSVVDLDREMSPAELSALSRIASKNKKKFLLLSATQIDNTPSKVTTSEIEWFQRST